MAWPINDRTSDGRTDYLWGGPWTIVRPTGVVTIWPIDVWTIKGRTGCLWDGSVNFHETPPGRCTATETYFAAASSTPVGSPGRDAADIDSIVTGVRYNRD